MGLGNNRDYKTNHRRVVKNLARHAARMAELQAQGIPREEASAQAMRELLKRKPVKNANF